jgi:hypothetical protein
VEVEKVQKSTTIWTKKINFYDFCEEKIFSNNFGKIVKRKKEKKAECEISLKYIFLYIYMLKIYNFFGVTEKSVISIKI